ncbi:MAG: hypothetical protein ACI9FD_000896 [Gammaproteobacteria bacterium]|jgi:hypothetical protein
MSLPLLKNATAVVLSTLFLVACGPQSESDNGDTNNAITATKSSTERPQQFIAEEATPLPLLWSDDHNELVLLASSLVNEAPIQAAKSRVVELYKASPSGQVEDGLNTMEAAIDHMVFGSLLSTVSENLAAPKVAWSETIAYWVGDRLIPDSRYAGETPDRIYQNVALSSDYRYELHGQRPKNHSLDIIIEVLPGPANWGLPPLAAIHSDQIDFANDGSFMVTMDNTPTEERRNHLQLPQGTKLLLIRDSVTDWANHLPTKVSVKGLDAENTADIPREQLIASSAEMIVAAAETSLKFYAGIWQREVNQLTTYVRDLGWGIVGLNPFSIADDQALVVTVDPLKARYFTLQVQDLWLESTEYIEHTSTLNIDQSKANADGTITYVVATQDPGYYNWIDTGGLNNGFLVGRWELFKEATSGEGAVRSVQLINLKDLASIMPEGSHTLSSEQRQQQLSERKAAYNVRLGK